MKLLLPILILLFAAPAFSQFPVTDGLQVDGVRLGAAYQAVIRKFGKPVRESTTKTVNECTGTHIRTVNYPGLKIELDDAAGGFKAFSFEITSDNHDVSGIKIGASTAAVQKRFGTRQRTVEKQKTGLVWFYTMTEDNPGGSTFYFQNGKLLKIQTTYEMC